MRTTLIEKIIQIDGGAPFLWTMVLFLGGLVVLTGKVRRWRSRPVFFGLALVQFGVSAAAAVETWDALGSWAEHIRDPALNAYFIGAEFDILFWMLVLSLGSGVVTGLVAAVTAVRMPRHRVGECERCRYPLDGLGSDPRCPECGVKGSRKSPHAP